MTGTLIFILFLLNILLAFALLLLFMRQNRLMDTEKRQKLLLEESEQVMAAMVEEFKEENERLLSRLNAIRETEENSSAHAKIDEKNPEPENETAIEMPMKDLTETEENQHPPQTEEPEQEMDRLPLREQVELLAGQGMTVTEIARKLDKGKTEIELLMKFR